MAPRTTRSVRGVRQTIEQTVERSPGKLGFIHTDITAWLTTFCSCFVSFANLR